MIARLRGEVIEASSQRLVILCHGVGYEVNVPETVAVELGIIGEHIDLFTKQVIREDEHNLYGFATARQKRLFELLREVKGCGSKTSLGVISTLSEAGAVQAIAASDTKSLALTPGIGLRLAERIVLELKDKILELQVGNMPGKAITTVIRPTPQDDPLAEALISLGYKRNEFEDAAAAAREETDDLSQQVRIALKRLSK